MEPAAIRYGNPLGQYPNRWTALLGSLGTATIGGGHLIAAFTDPIAGASANVATMSSVYGSSTIADMIRRWSGGNNWQAYLSTVTRQSGVSPDARVSDVLASPQGPGFLSAMAQWEAGRPGVLSLEQWGTAIAQGVGAVGNPTLAQFMPPFDPMRPPSRQAPIPGAPVPGIVTGAAAWLETLFTRGAVIVLGLIVLAVGLALFGRTRPQDVAAAVEPPKAPEIAPARRPRPRLVRSDNPIPAITAAL